MMYNDETDRRKTAPYKAVDSGKPNNLTGVNS